MKRKCKECKKHKNSAEFSLIEMDMPKRLPSALMLTHKFKDTCDDCVRLNKKKDK